MFRRSLPAVLFAGLFAAAQLPGAVRESFPAVVYEARKPEYAALAKQSASFREKLAVLPDDEARAVAAESFARYLDALAKKLADSGRSAYAAEARGYRASVLAFRDELLAPPPSAAEPSDDPLAAGEADDPFAGEADDPFADADPLDPLAGGAAEDPLAGGGAGTAESEPIPEPAEPTVETAAAGDPDEPVYGEAPAAAAPDTPAAPPAPAAPSVAAAPAGERRFLVDPTRITVEATTPGLTVGPFEEGDLLVLRYASGTWTSDEKKHFPTTPDVPRMAEAERLALVGPDGGVTFVPGQTDAAPFVHKIEAAGPINLRIGEDPGQDLEFLDDNKGAVTYLAYVLGPEDEEAFRASPEGKRCQFGTTAAERREAEEAAAAARGDPFTLETTKKDGEADFDFTQNGGVFTIKIDGTVFGTKWGRGPGKDLVFAYSDLVRQVGGEKGFKRLPNTAKGFDDLVFAPGSRPVRKGEVVVFQNTEGRLLAVRVDDIRLATGAPGSRTRLSIHYRVY